jgi:hypothetical protein
LVIHSITSIYDYITAIQYAGIAGKEKALKKMLVFLTVLALIAAVLPAASVRAAEGSVLPGETPSVTDDGSEPTPETSPIAPPLETPLLTETPAGPSEPPSKDISSGSDAALSPSPEPMTADKAVTALKTYEAQEFYTQEDISNINCLIEYLINSGAAADGTADTAWLDAFYARVNGIEVKTPAGVTTEGAALSVPADNAQGASVELTVTDSGAADLLTPAEYAGAPTKAFDISLRYTVPSSTFDPFAGQDAGSEPIVTQTPVPGSETLEITEPAVPVTLTMPVPVEVIGLEGLTVLHYHDETAAPEVILPELNIEGTAMTFEANSFSTFVITGKPAPKPEPDYWISVPAVIDFGTLRLGMGAVSKPLTLQALGLNNLAEKGFVQVKISGDFTLATKSGKTLGLTVLTPDGALMQSGNVFCKFDYAAGGAAEKTGAVRVETSAIRYAGNYSRVLTFTYEYKGGGYG